MIQFKNLTIPTLLTLLLLFQIASIRVKPNISSLRLALSFGHQSPDVSGIYRGGAQCV